jgi:hypothetical protein
LRTKVEKQVEFAKSQTEGSNEAKLAWIDLEELDAALSHLTKARKPKINVDMASVIE